jgi:hypothetical protein
MATTTPNFGWAVPTSTDLVKDGAVAIETLGDSIDASLVDLKGGTTGQVLAKATNTDMDFSWVAQDDSNAIQNAIVDAKGDIIAATAADTPARLAVGTNNQVLTADSTTATGLKWATPASAASSWVKIVQTSMSGVASQTFDNCYSATYTHYVITLNNMSGSTSSADFLYQARTATPSTITTNYYGGNLTLTYNSSTPTSIQHNAASAITIAQDVGNSVTSAGGILFVSINNSRSTSVTGFYSDGNSAIGNSPIVSTDGGGSGGISGFILSVASGTMTGLVTVYGVTQ